MAQTREKVTVWWLEDHYGDKLPTLESCEVTRTERMVYAPDRIRAWGYAKQVGIDRVHFTPGSAVAAGISFHTAKRNNAEKDMHKHADAIQALLEIREGLNADR